MTDSVNFKGKEIPKEIILAIFVYLDSKNLCNCSLVSKTFKKISNEDLLWELLFIKDHILKPNDQPKASYIRRTVTDKFWFSSLPNFSTIQTKGTIVNTIQYKKDFISKGKGVIACGLNNNTIELYTINGSDIKLSKIFEDKVNGPQSSVLCLDYSEKLPKRMLSSGFDNFICTWDLESGKLIDKFKNDHKYGVWSTRILTSNSCVTCGDDKFVRVYDLEKKKSIFEYKFELYVYDSIPHQTNSNIIISGSVDRTIGVFDIRDPKIKNIYQTKEKNYELTQFAENQFYICQYQNLEHRDFRKFDKIVSNFEFFETPSRSPCVTATKILCTSKQGIHIFSENPTVIKKYLNKEEPGIHQIRKIGIQATQLQADDEFIISSSKGVLTIQDFKLEKKQCKIQ